MDPLVADYDRLGKPTSRLPDDAPSVTAIRGLLDQLGLA